MAEGTRLEAERSNQPDHSTSTSEEPPQPPFSLLTSMDDLGSASASSQASHMHRNSIGTPSGASLQQAIDEFESLAEITGDSDGAWGEV